MTFEEWKQHLTKEQLEKYIQLVVEQVEDDYELDKNNKPVFWAGPPNSGQSMPMLVWNEEAKRWEEGGFEDEDE